MSLDTGRAAEHIGVRALLDAREAGKVKTQLRVEKFDLDQLAYTRRKLELPKAIEPSYAQLCVAKVRPFEIFVQEDANLITDAGWGLLMNGIAGSSVTKFSATVGRIGSSAGGATATTVTPAYSDTNLAYTTTNYWQLLSAAPTVGGSPQHTSGLAFAATVGTANGNWQWMEAATDQGTASASNASATATMLNHLGWSTSGYTGPGTKTSAQTWNVTETITWT